jgi:NSS family neurotransmitter:Na+ symporter
VQWRSRTTFVLALAASAVGFGNFWRFSYLAGENGGGFFVLAYLACLFLVAVPVLVAEVVIGTHGRASPVAAVEAASDGSLVSRGWKIIGLLACLAGLLLVSYYAVVAGWALAYTEKMQSGEFSAASVLIVGQSFEEFLRSPRVLVYWQSLFLLAAGGVVAAGVRRGLGLAVWILVPAILALLAVLVDYSLTHGDLAAAKDFLFEIKPIDFTAESLMAALVYAFYTLGVGAGVGIIYGAYAPERIPVGRSVVAVAVFDTLVSLGAGLAIYPLVFANNLEPTMGPSLLFISIPYAYGNLPQGEVFGLLFFVMVLLAALGSVIALMEPITAYVMQRTGLFRLPSAALVTLVVWGLGVGSVLSFNIWRDAGWFSDLNFFEVLEHTTADLLLPLVSLLLAVFVGWRMRPEILRLELYRESSQFFALWRFLLRYIVPAAIGTILLVSLITFQGTA